MDLTRAKSSFAPRLETKIRLEESQESMQACMSWWNLLNGYADGMPAMQSVFFPLWSLGWSCGQSMDCISWATHIATLPGWMRKEDGPWHMEGIAPNIRILHSGTMTFHQVDHCALQDRLRNFRLSPQGFWRSLLSLLLAACDSACQAAVVSHLKSFHEFPHEFPWIQRMKGMEV